MAELIMVILRSWPIALCLSFSLLLSIFSVKAVSEENAGKLYTVALLDNDGVSIKVADLLLIPAGSEYRYELNMVTKAPFQNYFLSMRPFNCITESETKRSLCYLNYPYKNNRIISATDLGDLEYDLLFIRRKASDYGIDPWFGSYYKMRWEGENIIGEVYEADLDILAAPPEDGRYRPIAASDLSEAEHERFWLPRLLIEPVRK
jgi:hypothetical protein